MTRASVVTTGGVNYRSFGSFISLNKLVQHSTVDAADGIFLHYFDIRIFEFRSRIETKHLLLNNCLDFYKYEDFIYKLLIL